MSKKESDPVEEPQLEDEDGEESDEYDVEVKIVHRPLRGGNAHNNALWCSQCYLSTLVLHLVSPVSDPGLPLC